MDNKKFKGDENICLYCNNEGRSKEDPFSCPNCGRKWKAPDNGKIISKEFIIPEKYNKKLWDEETFIRRVSGEGIIDIHSTKWARELIEYLKEENLFSSNVLISAQRGSGARRYIYYLLRNRELQNKTVYKPINLGDIEIKDLDFKNTIKNYQTMSFFIPTIDVVENIKKLNFIIPIRENLDYETIVYCNFNYSKFVEELNNSNTQIKSEEFSFSFDKEFIKWTGV